MSERDRGRDGGERERKDALMELWKWRRPHDPPAKYSTGDVDGYSCVRRGSEPRISLLRYNFISPSMLCELTFPPPPPPPPSVFPALPPENIFPLPIKLTDFFGRRRVSTVYIQHWKKNHTLVAYEHVENTSLCVFIMLPVWEFVYMFMGYGA